MGKRLALVTTLLITLASFAPAAPAGAAGEAQVRVVHASPDTPPVDVYVDGVKALSALGFTKASDYLPLPAGRHDFQLFQAGVTPANGEPVIQAKGVEIATGAKLSIVAIGWLASIRTLVVDDKTAAPAPGKMKLRFVHVGPDVQAVDLAMKGGTVLAANGQFGSAYPYQEVDARQGELEIRPAGTPNGVVAVPFAPEAGKTYSAYLMSLGALKVLVDTTASDTAPGATTSGASPPILGQTGQLAPRRASDRGLLLLVLAGVGCITAGWVVGRRAAR